ncbi:uroporphyrinogen-III synthase [Nesterenkonia haasae]|uniref:uroporphyrinogen-III synthase n=1 Tax=Nesterenkonia haasae TaxID=2587813 RepID=UPI001390DFAC|nr:uroporphyrinogen-III synthase [Nesterenkonia haasae]NDK31398.1 uroporphyrinogen-III synthase [Nesterenkonia haasae]
MRIVLTRHSDQTGDLEAGLRQAGHICVHMPLTQQILPENRSELSTAIQRLEQGDFTWLLLTSANTVRALLSCGWSGAVPEKTSVGVVGPGTARILEERCWLKASWMPQDHSAAGMLAEMPTPESGTNLLLPQSAQARPDLAQGLSAKGWNLTQVTAYATVPLPRPELDHPEPELTGDDAVLVTSSSAAEVWVTLRAPRAKVLAIGRPTAETLRQLGRPADTVLGEPTAAGVLQALAQLDL